MNRYKRKHWCEWQDFPHEIVKGPIGIEYALFMRVSFDNQRRIDVYPFIISMKYLYRKINISVLLFLNTHLINDNYIRPNWKFYENL